MNEEEIRKYADLMRELGIEELSVAENGITLRLQKRKSGGNGSAKTADVPQTDNAASAQTKTQGQGELIPIKSNMVGVFYAAPAENEDPFVSVGSRVKEGDTLFIIEAMKLMNEIKADLCGVVEKICVTNGQMVEFGTEIMQIRRQESV